MRTSIIAIVALFAISLVSCKKDHECVCTVTRTNGSTTTTTDDDHFTFHDTKKRAKSRCDFYDGSGDFFGPYVKECEIK